MSKTGSSDPTEEISDGFKNNESSRSSNTRRTCEFIPLDWDIEMELARDEPLPDVPPIEENSGEFAPIQESTNNSSVISNKTVTNVGIKSSYKVPEIILEEPSEINAGMISTGSKDDKVLIPSKSTLKKSEISKSLEYRDPVIFKKSEAAKPIPVFNNHLMGIENLPVATPVKNGTGSFEKAKVDTLGERFNLNLDLGVDHLPFKTPVKDIKMEKENFTNPLTKSRQFFKNQPIHSLHTSSSKFSATPISMDKFNKSVKTPLNQINLLKNAEISSASRVLVGKTRCEKFPKIIVNGTEYFNMKILGKGGSSVVYQCFDDTSKENRAIKCVSLDSPISSEEYRKEIEILRRLQNCDRIITMYNYQFLMKEKKLYIVLEMGSVDLSEILKDLSKNENVVLPTYLILFYWMEMLYAVQQIHSYGIIHSDLKPANFLQVNGRLKLIDFGISSCVQNDTTSVIKTVSQGSSNYISPEALNCEVSTNKSSPNYGKPKYRISYRADVWSLGCIFYQLIYKKPPFHHITNLMQKLMAIANSRVSVEYADNVDIPKRFLETIKKCLVFNAKSRPSVDELISEYEQFCKI